MLLYYTVQYDSTLFGISSGQVHTTQADQDRMIRLMHHHMQQQAREQQQQQQQHSLQQPQQRVSAEEPQLSFPRADPRCASIRSGFISALNWL